MIEMGLVRKPGESLSDAKARRGGNTMHGSVAQREMAKWGGQMQRKANQQPKTAKKR